MYSERLSLRISAERAGWDTVEPPTLAGASGVVQKFAFLAMKGPARVAFDIVSSGNASGSAAPAEQRVPSPAIGRATPVC